MVDSIALVLGGLVGGVIATFSHDLGSAFLWSIPLALGSIVALWKFNEPQLHKAEPLGSVKEQIIETFTSVLNQRSLVRILAVLLLLTLTMEMLFEFNQLWYIAVHTPPVWFGVIFALIISTSGIGGYLAGKIKSRRTGLLLPLFATLLISTAVMSLPIGVIPTLSAQIAMGIITVLLTILLKGDLHNQLPSRVRAGAASAVSTIGRLLLIPTGLIFGFLSTSHSVFAASWILVAIVVLAAASQFLPRRFFVR
jgi:hypothetical protein